MGIVVNGYHGTSQTVAELVEANGAASMWKSANTWDWLGFGAYFWQDGRNRAREWAMSHHAGAPAVLHAEIDLDNCMDLLDSDGSGNPWLAMLRREYRALRKSYTLAGLSLPKQTNGRHPLDRLVIDRAARAAALNGTDVWSVRAGFREGQPIYPNSQIYELAHVQIAVRDSRCIRAIRMTS